MTEKNSGKKATIKQTSIIPIEEPTKASPMINKDEDQVEIDSEEEEDNYEDDQDNEEDNYEDEDDQDSKEPKGLGFSPAQ